MVDHPWLIVLDTWPHVAASLLPVCLFLIGLVALDSYKLVRLRHLIGAMTAGIAAAALSFFAQTSLGGSLGLDVQTMARYVAPLVEEGTKALFLIYLIRSHRVGFVVDAAVLGFAVGTGFALAENAYYLQIRTDAGLITWIVRGLGTAVMHGGATSIYAMISKTLADRTPSVAAYLPGLVVVYVVHSFFNHFFLPPAAMTGLFFVVLPGLMAVVFYRTERSTRRWLGRGFDADQRLLEQLTFQSLNDDRTGRYLQELRHRFPGEVVADMLCLVRLRAELSVKAKGLMLMRKAGFRVPSPGDVQETLEEVRHLEDRIGPTGMLALRPVLRPEHRDLWQLRLLGG